MSRFPSSFFSGLFHGCPYGQPGLNHYVVQNSKTLGVVLKTKEKFSKVNKEMTHMWKKIAKLLSIKIVIIWFIQKREHKFYTKQVSTVNTDSSKEQDDAGSWRIITLE